MYLHVTVCFLRLKTRFKVGLTFRGKRSNIFQCFHISTDLLLQSGCHNNLIEEADLGPKHFAGDNWLEDFWYF